MNEKTSLRTNGEPNELRDEAFAVIDLRVTGVNRKASDPILRCTDGCSKCGWYHG